MKYVYTTNGTCSKQIEISINDESQIVESVCFIGGCPGNTIGISSLVKGLSINEVIKRLKGIPCGSKSTSCPDQLARALEEIKSNY